jgi:hypothetical protein
MSYNRFRWWSKGIGRKKRLPSSAPLLARIQNGDFEYSPYFYEAELAQQDADRIYKEVWDRRSKFSDDKLSIDADARDASKLRRLAKAKLIESGVEEEQKLLHQLKIELEDEFGKNLWDKCLEKQRGKGTTEDMYWWYKKEVGGSYTKSELKMRGINVKR